MSLLLDKVSGADRKENSLNYHLALIVLLLVSFYPVNVFSKADVSGNAGNQLEKFDREQALAFSQAALNRTIGDYQFTDQDRKQVDFSDYRGKPLLVSLIYTSCHHICPTLTSHLAEMVEIAQEALGEDSFSVLTIGFDTAVDSPERMRLFARERNIDMPQWDFLSADQATIETFTRETGFVFYRTGKGFDHLMQTTLLDSNGRIYRQIYGTDYESQTLIEPLKELVFGRRTEATVIENLINNIKLFCTIYDPHTGRYEFDYSLFISIGMGILVLGSIGFYLVRAWRKTDTRGLT